MVGRYKYVLHISSCSVNQPVRVWARVKNFRFAPPVEFQSLENIVPVNVLIPLMREDHLCEKPWKILLREPRRSPTYLKLWRLPDIKDYTAMWGTTYIVLWGFEKPHCIQGTEAFFVTSALRYESIFAECVKILKHFLPWVRQATGAFSAKRALKLCSSIFHVCWDVGLFYFW